MIFIVCKTCGTAIRTSGEPDKIYSLFGEGSDWYPDKFPCPELGCGRNAEFIEHVESMALATLKIHDLSPEEAFSAFSGLGMPDEHECGPLAVQEALKSPIKNIDAKILKGSNRSIIYWLETEDGTRIYLGSSPYGAIVYRIANRHYYSAGVSDAG